jgi:hypothetical protein
MHDLNRLAQRISGGMQLTVRCFSILCPRSVAHPVAVCPSDLRRERGSPDVRRPSLHGCINNSPARRMTTVALLVTFQIGFVGQVIWAGIAPAMLGISTMLIHARIGLGWAHEAERNVGSNSTRIVFGPGVEADALDEEHELGQRRK